MTRLLGIDLGERRIGLALGDPDTGSVRLLTTLARRDPEHDAATIARIAAEQRAGELVVGLPRNMDGSEGPQAAATRLWGDALAARIGLPLTWRDERLTSVTAEARLGRPPRGRSGGPPSPAARARRRGQVDQEAAALIVQAELDRRGELVRP